MWAQNSVDVYLLEFPVWRDAFGLTSQKEKLGKMQVCSAATNLVTLGEC